MKNRNPLQSRRPISPCAIFAIVIILLPGIMHAGDPIWWSNGVKSTNPATDYAAVNQGQVKNMAKAAMEHLDATMPGGAGSAIHAMVDAWSSPSPTASDYAAVNIGQLKALAQPFYTNLLNIGYITAYPWDTSANPKNDYALANIGQVKNLFSFDLTNYDWSRVVQPSQDWAQAMFGTGSVDPSADSDGDGTTNLQEYLNGTDPNAKDCPSVKLQVDVIVR